VIRELQDQHAEWLSHNFPHQMPHQPLLGICEEVGELAHVHLKREQGIRRLGGDSGHDLTIDALGDIFIYMMSYANSAHIDLEQAITDTWARVSKRDWEADPETGGET
jgi:NTP pyrophosphatase (non-canonical NTP hydrolase)